MGNSALIYRFSKAQDCIGNKLFKAFLLYQGENVDRPFLDILNNLEKIKLLSVDTWFELREIRNEIAHDYEDSKAAGKNIINGIISYKDELKRIVSLFKQIG
jgi:CHASE3 domain sensor protein